MGGCVTSVFVFFYFFFNFCNVYLHLREGQREGDTESQAGSRLRAVGTEPDVGLEPTDREIVT